MEDEDYGNRLVNVMTDTTLYRCEMRCEVPDQETGGLGLGYGKSRTGGREVPGQRIEYLGPNVKSGGFWNRGREFPDQEMEDPRPSNGRSRTTGWGKPNQGWEIPDQDMDDRGPGDG